jgi:exodeoxyribonuclease VII large subunit
MRIAALRLGLDDKFQQLKSALVRHTVIKRIEAVNLGEHLRKASPLQKILDRRAAAARLRGDLIGQMRRLLEMARRQLSGSSALLDSLSPLSILGRGYAIAFTEPAGAVITDSASVSRGDTIRVKVAKGDILASVDQTVEGSKGGYEEGKI